MSSINAQNSKTIANKGDKMVGRKTQHKSPYKNDKLASSLNMNFKDLNITLPSNKMSFIERNTNNFIYDINDGKNKMPSGNKKPEYLSKINNNINFDFSDNTYMFPMDHKNISVYADSAILNTNTSNTKNMGNKNKTKVLKNSSMQNMKPKNLKDDAVIFPLKWRSTL